MTITLELMPETQRRLETLATKSGQDVTGFVHNLIEKTVQDNPALPVPAERTFDEILAPFRQGFDESGMNEKEITVLFDAELKAVRAERTFDEIAAPIREDFKASVMTEEAFDTLIEELRKKVWQKKRSGAKV